MELFLDGLQVVKNVRMVELKVIENQRTRAVVNELRALIEESAVVFIGFNHEERAVAKARGHLKVARYAADDKARLVAAGFKDPGRHSGSGGFTMRPGNRQHPAIAQDKVVQPLRPGHIRDVIFQHRFHARVAARHRVTDDHQIRLRIQLAGIISLN